MKNTFKLIDEKVIDNMLLDIRLSLLNYRKNGVSTEEEKVEAIGLNYQEWTLEKIKKLLKPLEEYES